MAEEQVTKEPQQVTTKNLKKVEAGKRLAAQNHRKREEERRTESTSARAEQSEPILQHWSHSSCGGDRRPCLLHLSNLKKESDLHTRNNNPPQQPRPLRSRVPAGPQSNKFEM